MQYISSCACEIVFLGSLVFVRFVRTADNGVYSVLTCMQPCVTRVYRIVIDCVLLCYVQTPRIPNSTSGICSNTKTIRRDRARKMIPTGATSSTVSFWVPYCGSVVRLCRALQVFLQASTVLVIVFSLFFIAPVTHGLSAFHTPIYVVLFVILYLRFADLARQ